VKVIDDGRATHLVIAGYGPFAIPAALDAAQRAATPEELADKLHDQLGNVNPFVLAELIRRGRYDLLRTTPQPGCTMAQQFATMLTPEVLR
jgi:hypothetical protein